MKKIKTQHMLMADNVEWAKVKRLASECNMSTSAYVVKCSLADDEVDEPEPDIASDENIGQNYETNLQNKLALNSDQQRHLYDLVQYLADARRNDGIMHNGKRYTRTQMLHFIYSTHELVFKHVNKSRDGV